ncbi:MAG: pyridoxamine 5'-phosphate oxidase family protein [Methanomicrobia archaeon]|nr:pyridoxamine 5'-phosphate oxidase family protein [Methanomicrobia archaeon]
MNLQDCITFANENPVASVATIEGDQPRVRLFAMWFADKTGFYFHTGTIKSIYKQLQRNPKVELCFYNPGDALGGGKMLRASGVVDFVDDTALKERLFEERPFLKAIAASLPSDHSVVIFRVHKGAAWFWTMEINTRESEAERIPF